MDRIRSELAEQKDAEEEAKTEKKIQELRNSAQEKLDEDIKHSQTQHLRNLQRIQTEQKNFLQAIEKMKEEDQQNVKDKKSEILKKAEERMVNSIIRCDAVTRSALDDLEETKANMTKEALQLEKDNVEAKAKAVEIEVDVRRQIFEEISALSIKDASYLTEKRDKVIREQNDEIRNFEQRVLTAERAERMKDAEMKPDLMILPRLELLDLAAFLRSADERKSRRQINGKIMEVKNMAQELGYFFSRAYKVLNETPENYGKMKSSKKRATKRDLIRCSEILSAIVPNLCDIEPNLASFEREDVKITDVNRQIRAKISSLDRIIANFIFISEVDGVAIDPTKTEEFARTKDTLFEQINSLDVISEKRDDVVDAI